MAGLIGALRETEVGQFGDASLGDEDVVRLDVPMDDVARMGMLEGAGNVEGDVHRIADRQLTEAGDQRVGTAAVHVLENEIVLAGRLILGHAEAANDVRMVHRHAAAGFAVKTIDVALVASEAVGEHLNGNLLLVPFAVAKVDRPHAALAELAEDAIITEAVQLTHRFAGRPDRRLRRGRRCGRRTVAARGASVHLGGVEGQAKLASLFAGEQFVSD